MRIKFCTVHHSEARERNSNGEWNCNASGILMCCNIVELTDVESLRDDFAKSALNGILAFPGTIDNNNTKLPIMVAGAAYNYADAMLARRQQP